MLRIYTGRENIDKERFIYDRVKERGGETFVLVPDQYTLVAEEQALRFLGTDCLFDTEILSMNRLGLRVLTEQGAESVRMLDKYGRFMLLNKLVKEHMEDFELFARSAGKITFTAMLNDFISEFKQQDCTLAQLEEMLGQGDRPGGQIFTEGCELLGAKLRELSGVISAYEEAIKGRYTDAEDYISMYISAIKDSALVRGKTFWIYGYDSITPKFADAVMELASAAESVNFMVNSSDFGLDEQLIASLIRLAKEKNIGISVEETENGQGDRPGGQYPCGRDYVLKKSETIERIERSLWKDVLTEEERRENADFVPEDLTLVCASNPYAEAENAAAYIWHLVRDLGYRMKDIQVIANDEGSMHPVVRRVFAEYGLPVFSDTSRDITDSAAVAFIVELLDFVQSRGVSRHLFAMLKTGLSGFPDSDIEELENYARAYRIKGSMWGRPFRYGEKETGSEKFGKLESMRAAIAERTDALASAAKKKEETVAGFTAAFRAYLDDEWKLSEKVEEAAAEQDSAGLHDEAQRMTQSFDKAMELLDQIDEIMGGSAMDLKEFTDIYKAGLSDVEVGVIPPSVDGLSMGTMIRTRPRQMRAAVILGANEGTLPLEPQTEGLFSTDEKEFFRERGFALGSLDDIKMDEEKAAMYRMMARPSEKLYISWSMADAEGKDSSPSSIIDSLRMLFPRIEKDGLVKRDMISGGWGESLIQTADESMRHLTGRIKDSAVTKDPDALTKAVLRWYGDNRRSGIENMLEAAAYENDPAPLRKDMARSLFARSDGRLVMSASSIDSYIGCPFRYYVERGLRPEEERSFSADSRSVGDVYHECLMAVAKQIMGEKDLSEKIRNGDTEEIERIAGAALDEISGRYRGGLFISAGSEEYRMSRIREICMSAAKAMAAQLSAGSVTRARFEENIGRDGSFGPLRLEVDGEEVLVEGKIDRADYLDTGEEERIRIIDYKTGPDALDLWKMRHGLKMQLMIYLISASDSGPEPAGMFYFNIKDPIENANGKSSSQMESIAGKNDEDIFRLRGAYVNEEGVLEAMPEKVLVSAKKSGISREEYEAVRSDVLERIEETAEGILSGKIGIHPLRDDKTIPCYYCDYKAVCRTDRSYAKNRERRIPPRPGKTKKDDE